MKPQIQIETVEKLTEAVNGTTAELDDLIHILKEDIHWQLTSIEQCETFLTNFLRELMKTI